MMTYIKLFEFEYEALDWSHEEVQRRIDFTVQHSSDTVSEEEYKEIEEYEYYLVRMEEINNTNSQFISQIMSGYKHPRSLPVVVPSQDFTKSVVNMLDKGDIYLTNASH